MARQMKAAVVREFGKPHRAGPGNGIYTVNTIWKGLLGSILFIAASTLNATVLPSADIETKHARQPDVKHGSQLFAICARCHGPAGGGNAQSGIPSIAGQHYEFIAKQLVDYRYFRRWDPSMETLSADHHLRDMTDVADVAAFVSSLPARTTTEYGTSGLAQHGKSLYARKCASCHGTNGRGDPRAAIPRLAGQHYSYLLRQMHDAVEGRRPNFTAQHVDLLEPLDRDDLLGIAEYLSREAP